MKINAISPKVRQHLLDFLLLSVLTTMLLTLEQNKKIYLGRVDWKGSFPRIISEHLLTKSFLVVVHYLSFRPRKVDFSSLGVKTLKASKPGDSSQVFSQSWEKANSPTAPVKGEKIWRHFHKIQFYSRLNF